MQQIVAVGGGIAAARGISGFVDHNISDRARFAGTRSAVLRDEHGVDRNAICKRNIPILLARACANAENKREKQRRNEQKQRGAQLAPAEYRNFHSNTSLPIL